MCHRSVLGLMCGAQRPCSWAWVFWVVSHSSSGVRPILPPCADGVRLLGAETLGAHWVWVWGVPKEPFRVNAGGYSRGISCGCLGSSVARPGLPGEVHIWQEFGPMLRAHFPLVELPAADSRHWSADLSPQAKEVNLGMLTWFSFWNICVLAGWQILGTNFLQCLRPIKKRR